ncbi:MAG TPA: cupin domain-containing protein [Rhodanobacter sp.]|nr:cupin domain-containing protein [Rhodanobacter sp.]
MPADFSDLCIELAEVVLPAGNFPETLRFFIGDLGFRLDSIIPADNPRMAQLSGHGLRLRLDAACSGDPGVIRLGTAHDGGREAIVAPNRTRIEFGPARPALHLPALQASLCIQRLDGGHDDWKCGRAGMHYRDLIPGRQGGQFIASHIRIPAGGPVGDNVHYHDIRLQLIYCHRGWVRLVYEDQGEPFVMHAGDCVLQPPQIRHRVLEASAGLEVIEIGSPAEHMTHLDHAMTLPTGRALPQRAYGDGQAFVFHQAAQARWRHDHDAGWQVRDLGIAGATGGLAGARVVRWAGGAPRDSVATRQDRTFAFAFVLQGNMSLHVDQLPATRLSPGDAFVIPTGMRQRFADCSGDWELLQVFLPA